jgi:hypothetical protein
MRLLYLSFLAVLVPSAADADCALSGLAPKVINDGNASFPADGAFVVAAVQQGHGKLDPGDITVHSEWTLHVDGKPIAPKIDTIAPGLSLYRVDGRTGTLRLEDGARKSLATGKAVAAKRTPFPAPVVKKLTNTAGGYHRNAAITAELDGAVPGGAIAIVMYDEKGTPRSWGLVTAGKPITPFLHTYCGTLPNGTLGSKVGDKVKLAWVDEAGRVSPTSKVIEIVR